MSAPASAHESSPDRRLTRAADLREDFVFSPALRENFSARVGAFVVDNVALFADDSAADDPPLSGHIRHATIPHLDELIRRSARDSEDHARFVSSLLLGLRPLFADCLLNAERYDEGLAGMGEFSSPNAVFFLAFLDIMKSCFETVVRASDIDPPDLLLEAIRRDHDWFADLARNLRDPRAATEFQ